MKLYLMGIFWGVLATLWVLFCVTQAAADFDFKNQMSVLSTGGLPTADYIDYGSRFDYEQYVGDPWSDEKAKALAEAGKSVSFNSNGGNAFKVWSFDGSYESPKEPTRVNKGTGNVAITDSDYRMLEKLVCMTQHGATMPYNKLYDPVAGKWKYAIYLGSKGSIQFQANRYTSEAVALQVSASMALWEAQEARAGLRLYTAIYFDETGFPSNYPPKCFNPGNPAGALVGDVYLYDLGRKKFIEGLVRAAKEKLGADYRGTSGNPYRVDRYSPEQGESAFPDNFLTLVHSESSGGVACDTVAELIGGAATGCGTQNSATYGVVSPSNVQVQLGPTNGTSTPAWFEADCQAAQLITGRAAGVGSYAGWFGQNNMTLASPCVHLARAIPNWDNKVAADGRVWDEGLDTYTSSNSYMSPEIAYSRHPKTRQLWLVRHSGSPTLKLKPGEIMTRAECTDSLFRVTATCMTGYFSQCGADIELGPNVRNGEGYILTIQEPQD